MLWKILIDISHLLDSECWYHDGAFHFELDGDWTLAVRADSMERVRISACLFGVERATLWSHEDRQDRIATIVLGARDEVLTAL